MANTSYPILLCNGGVNKNMCSLNSVLQLLGNIQEFCAQVQEWKNTSLLINELIDILCKRDKAAPRSALELRRLLALAANTPLNSGIQQDTVELFGFLLDHVPNGLFCFRLSYEYTACPSCKTKPVQTSSPQKFLRVVLPGHGSFQLEDLLKRQFSFQHQIELRQCIQCLSSNPQSPRYEFMEKCKITEYPEYLLIQLLRNTFEGGKTVKNSSPVHFPGTEHVLVDNCPYQIIGTISHIGTAEAGHNRAYIRRKKSMVLL